jgi:hypothetical protein
LADRRQLVLPGVVHKYVPYEARVIGYSCFIDTSGAAASDSSVLVAEFVTRLNNMPVHIRTALSQNLL